jgi:hypothetical protein
VLNLKEHLLLIYNVEPQGAVIFPILFNIYVKDLFEKIVSQRCKFADDSTMWKSGNDLVEVSD